MKTDRKNYFPFWRRVSYFLKDLISQKINLIFWYCQYWTPWYQQNHTKFWKRKKCTANFGLLRKEDWDGKINETLSQDWNVEWAFVRFSKSVPVFKFVRGYWLQFRATVKQKLTKNLLICNVKMHFFLVLTLLSQLQSCISS